MQREMSQMTLVEHLRELRKRLIYALIGVAVGFAVAYQFAGKIFDFLTDPLIQALPEHGKRLVFTGVTQPFFIEFKIGLFGGIILALPFILLQIWLFVVPALYPHERRYVFPVILSALLCFTGGAAFAYYVAFPAAFGYFLSYTTAQLQPMISMQEYLDFVTKMLLGFGALFELPLVLVFLARIGVVSPEFLSKNRRWAVLIIAVASAIVTPTPDALSMAILAVPVYLLFEISILLTRLVYKERPKLVDEKGDLTSSK